MPVLTAVRPVTANAVSAQALAQSRAALHLVRRSSEARTLAAGTFGKPDVDGALCRWLYREWWSGFDMSPTSTLPSPSDIAALETARRSVMPSRPDWLVLAASDDMLVAGQLRTGEQITARADAVVGSSRPGMPHRPGDLVTLLAGSSSLEPSQGWWWATTGKRQAVGNVPLDRWYVHAAGLDAALAAVPLLLGLLIRLDGDTSLKCPTNQALYARRDALVVYLPRTASPSAEAALPAIAELLAPLLEPEIPPLTRPMLPGLATAQNPSGVMSYGQLRCAQLAAVAAHTEADCSDHRLAMRLAEVGIDINHPELVPE
jgi:HopA1 effector protein family